MSELEFEDMTVPEKVEFVKGRIGPLDLADMFDLELHSDKIHSPFNEADRTPSCHLYEDGWFDYSTGRYGDVIDLYIALTGKSWGAALNRLGAGAERMDVDPDRIRREPTVLPDLTERWQLMPQCTSIGDRFRNALAPVSERFLTELWACNEIKEQFGSMFVAHWHGGVVRGIKVRGPGGKSAVPGSTFMAGLYRPLPDHSESGVAVITEGESDCWALIDRTIDAEIFSLPCGAGVWKDAWLEQLAGYDKIYTAFDNDRSGQAATEKVRGAIGWGRWDELKVPTLYKDVREALAAGWEPKL